jgi:hypothetical protein
MDPIDEIKELYFKATAQSIERDFARAIDLLKTLPDDEARGRVAVYMEGLAEMRNDWERRQKGGGAKARGSRGKRGQRPGGPGAGAGAGAEIRARKTPKPAK